MTDKPLSVKEAAEFLGVSAYTVAEYLRAGKLKGYKLGNGTSKKGSRRRWRIWEEDLVKFITRGSNIKQEVESED